MNNHYRARAGEPHLDDPVDDRVGGNDDVRATAQTISSAEIEAVTLEPVSREERRQTLLEMRDELKAREKAGNADLLPLIQEIDQAVHKLES